MGKASMKYDTIIIGGGTSGLVSAYELCKHSTKPHSILIVEKRKEFGGNVRSKLVKHPLTNVMYSIDFGVVEIWSQYNNVLEIMSELNVQSQLTSVSYPNKLVHYPKTDTYEKYNFSKSGLLEKAILLKKMYQLAHTDALSLYESKPIDFAAHNTISEVLKYTPHLRQYIKIMYEAYSYGSIEEEAFFLALPAILACDGPNEFSFNGNSSKLWIDSLLNYIMDHHPLVQVTLQSEKAVQLVNAKTKTIVIGSDVIEYENLIVANPLGTIDIHHSAIERTPSYHHPYPIDNHSKMDEYRYTHFYACCVYLSHMPAQQPWSANYEEPNHNLRLQVVAYSNLHELSNMNNCIIVYVCSRTEYGTEQLTQQDQIDVLKQIDSISFFKREQCHTIALLHHEYFSHCMPVMNEAVFQHLQSIQGKENIWYASQALNAYPSLESATYTGRLAAHHIMGTSELFMNKIRKWDKTRVNQFKQNLKINSLKKTNRIG